MTAVAAAKEPAIIRGPEMQLISQGPMNFAARIGALSAAKPNGIIRAYGEDGVHRTGTYAELWRRSGDVAAALREAGSERADRVVLLAESVLDFLPGYWACLRAGFTAIPLMGVVKDASRYGRAALDSLIALLGDFFVVTDDAFAGLTAQFLQSRAKAVIVLPAVSDAHRWIDEFDTISDPACMLATSGSTGRPKLAVIDHATQVYRNFSRANSKTFERPNALGIFPLDGLTGLMAGSLQHDSWTQIHGSLLTKKPASMLDAVEEFRISTTSLTNTLAELIIAEESRQHRIRDLSSLVSVGFGAEPIVSSTAVAFAQLLERHGAPPDVVRLGYGATETGTLTSGSSRFLGELRHPPCLGGAWMGVDIRIVGEDGEVLTEGKIGEVEVLCPTKMFSGYLTETGLSGPAVTTDGWWRTGDLGEIIEGELALHGRAKDVLFLHGKKFSLADIDAVIAGVIGKGDIAHSCAVVQPGARSEQLAVVVALGNTSRKGAQLAEKLRSAVVQGFGLHADPILFTDATRFPRTAGGKLRRSELARIVVSGEISTPVPEPIPISVLRPSAEPGQALPEKLAGIWSDVFGLTAPPEPNADFFDLGGDSLRALTLHLRIKDTLKVEVGSDAFFANPTFANLLQLVSGLAAAENEDNNRGQVRWALPRALRNHLLATFETWPGQRPTQDRIVVAANVQGRRPPLFWVFNEQHEFCSLAAALGDDQPLYAFPSGVSMIPADEDTNQTLALRYMAAIEEICPDSSFFIGGNCQGSIIALAIAQHALRRRRHVPLLMLLDWDFELQPYAGRTLFLSGHDNAGFETARAGAQPKLGWDRAFAEFELAELSSVYGQRFHDEFVAELAAALSSAMASALDRPARLLPRSAYRAMLVPKDIPGHLTAGEVRQIAVAVGNESGAHWGSSSESGVALESRWIDRDGDALPRSEHRTMLPRIAAQGQAEVLLDIVAPGEAGEYILELELCETPRRLFNADPFRTPISVTSTPTLSPQRARAFWHKRTGTRKSYRFSLGTDDLALLTAGWTLPESWGVWSNRATAKLRLPLRTYHGRWRAILTCTAFGLQDTAPVHVRVGYEGEDLAWTIPVGSIVDRTIDVTCAGHDVTLRFFMPEAVSPLKLGRSTDQRLLGLGLIALTIR